MDSSFGATSITEVYMLKKAMDMQIGALNAEKAASPKQKKSQQSPHINMQSSGMFRIVYRV